MNITSDILHKLKPYFWDTDIEKLDFEEYSFFVIERLLEYGRPWQINWLVDNYTRFAIKDVVRKSINISKKTANFWAIHYKIPTKEVRCLQK
jgi:hypothetical protein